MNWNKLADKVSDNLSSLFSLQFTPIIIDLMGGCISHLAQCFSVSVHSLLVSQHQGLDEAVTTLLKRCSVGHAGFEHDEK